MTRWKQATSYAPLYGGEGADTAAYEERIRDAFQIEAAEPTEKEAGCCRSNRQVNGSSYGGKI